MSARADGTLARHGGYPTPDGPRELLSVFNPDTGRYLLVDAFEQTVAGDLDPRIVDDELDGLEGDRGARARLPAARTVQGPTTGDAMTGEPPPGLELHGDEAQLYRQFAHELRSVVRRLVNTNPANIEDACQFSWLQLLRRQPRRETARAWLIAVARREAIRLHYAMRGHDQLDVGAVVGPHAEPAAAVDEFEQALELAEALAALAGLPERKRRLYLMKVLGFSYEEIGLITGDSYCTVNRQLARASRLIRRARGAGS